LLARIVQQRGVNGIGEVEIIGNHFLSKQWSLVIQ
jgi:hypothetical protein